MGFLAFPAVVVVPSPCLYKDYTTVIFYELLLRSKEGACDCYKVPLQLLPQEFLLLEPENGREFLCYLQPSGPCSSLPICYKRSKNASLPTLSLQACFPLDLELVGILVISALIVSRKFGSRKRFSSFVHPKHKLLVSCNCFSNGSQREKMERSTQSMQKEERGSKRVQILQDSNQ